MNNTIRERAVGQLAAIVTEMQNYERIYKNDDPAATKVIASARQPVIRLRDTYADGAPTEIDALAAQEMRELSDQIEKAGAKSGNKNAAETPKHLSGMLSHFVMTAAKEIAVDSEGRFRFVLAPKK